jgi:hypothetical protein
MSLITRRRLRELGAPDSLTELLPPGGLTLPQVLVLDVPEGDRLWVARVVSGALGPAALWGWQARFVARALGRVGGLDPRLAPATALISELSAGADVSRRDLEGARSRSWDASVEACRASRRSSLEPPAVRHAAHVAAAAALATARAADSAARHVSGDSSSDVLHDASLASRHAVSSAVNYYEWGRGGGGGDEEGLQVSDLVELLGRVPEDRGADRIERRQEGGPQ